MREIILPAPIANCHEQDKSAVKFGKIVAEVFKTSI
jgi:hypothetical protein